MPEPVEFAADMEKESGKKKMNKYEELAKSLELSYQHYGESLAAGAVTAIRELLALVKELDEAIEPFSAASGWTLMQNNLPTQVSISDGIDLGYLPKHDFHFARLASNKVCEVLGRVTPDSPSTRPQEAVDAGKPQEG